MKLVYKGHQAIQIEKGKFTVLATNNRHIYFDLIRGLQGFNDKLMIVDNDYQSLELEKAVDWDGDVVANNNLAENYSTEIVRSIIKNLTEDNRNCINTETRKLYSVVQELLFMTDLPLEVRYDGDIKRLLNYCRIKFSPLIEKNPYDIIKTDLKLHLECADSSCIGLSNVANYLSRDEFKELLQLNTELKIPVLLIEFTEIDNRQYYQNAEFYYIDEDFVDWKL
ncbi:type II-A CRISPR-associated protein Csn2 [Limosilactobacillus walteri]|uniref:Type II-A CRISPR-associated protein Csn2 n=1 Tax=Limosilactobacillus walteri TaxID=2268022 RepID=A0ABR8P7S9_9LACO|nr:type II-A CRISPR-associated protein Csn2 [Limosilactobacillus walteri]MBD5806793.1 type II-A CRISPR-associated protein Csn2 [Limosilactobacillus walteri]